MIGDRFAPGSFARRIVTRAVVVLGAVLLGGQVMRTLPHDQTLIFPIGSTFPNATRFSASWQQPGATEPSGGVTVNFQSAPPLQFRQHTRVPNGDYIVTILIVQGAIESTQTRVASEGLQTNIERRVNLDGGETLIALPSSTSPHE